MLCRYPASWTANQTLHLFGNTKPKAQKYNLCGTDWKSGHPHTGYPVQSASHSAPLVLGATDGDVLYISRRWSTQRAWWNISISLAADSESTRLFSQTVQRKQAPLKVGVSQKGRRDRGLGQKTVHSEKQFDDSCQPPLSSQPQREDQGSLHLWCYQWRQFSARERNDVGKTDESIGSPTIRRADGAI